MKNLLLKWLGLAGILLLIAVAGRYAIFAGVLPSTLNPITIEEEVARAVAAQDPNTTTPVLNKDFKVDNVQYFSNKEWVAARLKPLNKTTDTAFVVLKKQNAGYAMALGPGTDFSPEDTSGIPKEIADYLNSDSLRK